MICEIILWIREEFYELFFDRINPINWTKPITRFHFETVAERTIELIVHIENYRRKNNYSRIAYEVGTEEVVLLTIERAMDNYFNKFNLINLKDKLVW